MITGTCNLIEEFFISIIEKTDKVCRAGLPMLPMWSHKIGTVLFKNQDLHHQIKWNQQ